MLGRIANQGWSFHSICRKIRRTHSVFSDFLVDNIDLNSEMTVIIIDIATHVDGSTVET